MSLESRYNDNNRPHRNKDESITSKKPASTSKKYTLEELDSLLNIKETVSTQKQQSTSTEKPKKKNKKRRNSKSHKVNQNALKPVIDEHHTEPIQLNSFESKTVHSPTTEQDDEDIDMLLETLDNSDIVDPATMSHPTSGRVFQANPSLHVHTTFVVDTNFIIAHLDILEDLRCLFEKYQHTIVIPRYTVRELDGLKSGSKTTQSASNGGHSGKANTVAKSARDANTWIYANLANTASGVFGQRITQRINLNAVKDDAILDCCIYFKERLNCFVILLSNDRNLCLKALTEEILTVSYRSGMNGELIAERAFQENSYRFGAGQVHAPQLAQQNGDVMISSQGTSGISPHDMAFNDITTTIFENIKNTIIQALNYVMMDEYGDTINCLDFHSDDINGFKDIAKCIFDYWISVFCEYFRGSKLKREDWKGLPQELTSVPQTPEVVVIFQQFWSEILEHLIIKRPSADQKKLLAMIEEWRMLASGVTT